MTQRDKERKVARARELRGKGLTLEAIGKRLGHDHSVIWKWLNPEAAREQMRRDNEKRGPAKREWEAGECEQCGGRIAVRHRAELCRPCRRDENERKFKAKARHFIALREEGYLNGEIEKREQLPYNTVATVLTKAKILGMDVPRSPYFKAPA